MQIAVIGGGVCDAGVAEQARRVGRLLAQRGAVLICGGLGGVMEAAARGARETGGVTVGILPGSDLKQANPHTLVAVATGMGHARNAIVVQSAHAVIAFPGASGTLSEIALALTIGLEVVDLGGWSNVEGLIRVNNESEAVETAVRCAKRRIGKKHCE